MRTAVACVLVVGVGFLAALDMPAYPQDKPKTDAAGDALPAGVIRILAAPAFRHASPITGLAVVDGGKRIVTGSDDGAVLWDAMTGKRLKTLVSGKVKRLAATAKGNLLAVGLEGDVLKVYDLVAGKERFSLSQSNGHTYGLAFSHDGSLVASSAESGMIHLWETADGKRARSIKGPEVQIWALAFHPDGKRLYSGGTDSSVWEWDLATGKELRKLRDSNGGYVMGLSFNANGEALAVSANTNVGRLADTTARVGVFETATFQERFRATLPEAWVHGVTVSSNGRYVAAAFASAKPRDGRVGLWDTWTGKRIPLDVDDAHAVHFVHFLAEGKTLATAGADGAAHLWKVANGVEDAMTKGPAGPIRHVAFAPLGKMLASAGTGGRVQLWDTEKGSLLRQLRAHETPITSLAFSPSGKYLLAGSSQTTPPRNIASLWN
ncbi:MAG TPA: WD40 repeat domain-containing protein, partial [Gemmataceae bacterium]|nr:WD40 repeat domain-containing protein [Gemmataceae bacterium]